MSFSHVGLSPDLCAHLSRIGFTVPTPIQNESIPLVLRNHDLIASAQTGSGKTASFLLPMIDILSLTPRKARLPRALILVPTRELALQVSDQLTRFSPNPPSSAILVGGESMTRQEMALRKNPDVILATPGRFLDLMDREKILLHGVRYLVIDEADRMLDMGFLPDVTRILSQIKLPRQVLLFSATFPSAIQMLTQHFMIRPQTISIAQSGTTSADIEQYCVYVSDKQKRQAARQLVQTYAQHNESALPTLIFSNRKTNVSILVSSFKRHGYKVSGLHGDLKQSIRNKVMEDFKNKKIDILIASDIAARGIDVDAIGLVINFDVPFNTEDYVHRIGRTGRAGHKGIAFTLVNDRDKKNWHAVERFIKQKVCEKILVLTPEDDIKAGPIKKIERIIPHRMHRTDEQEEKKIFGFGEDIPCFFEACAYKKHLSPIKKETE
jgi:superfamily II DNA/RNA helicase